ncbi:calcyclin-binding protein-like [Biomphalaria glabrata]|uniref:Calcyclin-binding protein n=1 Tax=Biomphalaria glabrata TaxID=6526 RepID=A0A9W3BC84_BIOGL|nr:calcyclin-binding protein-like [Biomphalaria glabrata]
MPHQKLDELRLDLEEYEQLHSNAKRPRVQEMILKEISRVRHEITQLETTAASQTAPPSATPTVYEENITNYAWDQSDKFMKMYLTLSNLDQITQDSIQATFTSRSVTIKIQFPNKVSTLHIARLCEDVVPKECYCKKKSDYVLVMLKKSDVGKTWSYLTEREKKSKELKKPKLDEQEDPGDSLTKLLKNMYDDGDDEMKRTISKAFYESQKKQGLGDFPSNF